MTNMESEKVAVMAAYENFYVALNEMFSGNVERMSEVWSHADDIIYMGPDNIFLKGWPEIEQLWQKQAAVKMGGEVVAKDMELIINGDIAITNNYEVGQNTNQNGEVVKVSIRVTNIFRKENNQWKMIVHHTDLLPFLAE